MRIKRFGVKYRIDVFHGDKVNGHCPAVDILFESVAKECGTNFGRGIVAVVLGRIVTGCL